jgi:ADP-ribosylglycohydrolase
MHAGRGWELGEWTDDTAMALAIATAGESGQLRTHEVAANFLDWLGSGPKDVGIQTRRVLRAAAGDPSRVASCAAEHFRLNPRNSAGNGSLMRTAPVALSYLGDDAAIARAAREISDLTHADPVAGEACVLWSIAVDRAVREGRVDGVRDGLGVLDEARAKAWEAWL